MKQKLKIPKTNDNKLFNNDAECVLIGMMILLISIIGLLNKGPVGNFLTYIGIYLFGAFYFIMFVIAIFASIYLMIKKKSYKVTINMHLLGIILIFLSCLIASSTSNTEIRFSNLVEIFNEHMATVSSSIFVIDSISNLPVVGGGFIGYLLKALFNTCITETGTVILYISFMIIGIVLLTKDIIAYIIKFFINYNWKKKEKVAKEKETNNSTVQNIENESLPTISRLKEEEKALDDVEELPQVKSSDHYQVEKPVEQPKQYESPSSYFNDSINDNRESEISKPSSFTDQIEELDVPKQEQPKINYFDDFEESPKEEVQRQYDQYQEFNNSLDQDSVENYPSSNNQVNKPNVDESSSIESFPEAKVQPTVQTQSVEQFDMPTQPTIEPKTEPKPEVINHLHPKKVNKDYKLPSFDLLEYHPCEDTKAENELVASTRLEKINNTFQQFKIGARVVSYTIGPSVTRFNVKMNEGVRVNTLGSITNEISIALNGNKSVRLEMIVEGRDTSSIEVGNVKPTPVSFKECFEAVKDLKSPKDKLIIPLGKDIEGKVVTTHMDELPHLLVAGTTGSGKSVFVNTIIATFIMRNTPDELKLMLVDPKKVEFTKYNNLPHLLCPIITESREASAALEKLVEEMDDRYAQLSLRGVSKISEYNELAERKGFEKMSSIVLVVDEFADLVSKNAKEIYASVQRLCQKARAAGIYLIICTQRPSVNVITGDIKAVIPSRIALLVAQAVDSRTILDAQGAESLLGNGDMLCQIPKHNSLVRVQGAYISGVETAEVCDFIKSQQEVHYDPRFLNLIPQVVPGGANGGGVPGERRKELDELHEEAKAHVLETRIASTSNLQSYFGIGYARADHILNCLEDEGIVKRANGNRRIVVGKQEGEDEQ